MVQTYIYISFFTHVVKTPHTIILGEDKNCTYYILINVKQNEPTQSHRLIIHLHQTIFEIA